MAASAFPRTAAPAISSDASSVLLKRLSEHARTSLRDRLDLENVMVSKMMVLDSLSFENLLRPAFKDDEWIVVVLGAALGFLFGELQAQLILLLAH